MKEILLAITVSLMVPAYAAGPDDATCDELTQASDRISTLIEASRKKDLPLSDADKADMKQALEQFDKAMKDFYEVDKKIAKKKGHPKLKALGQGIVSYLNRPRSYSPYAVSPLMPMQNMMPTTFINPMPAYGQSPFTTFTPGFGNTYTVFHMPDMF
jgi:hypothetical protein